MSEQQQSKASIPIFPELMNRLLHVEAMLIVSMNAQTELLAAARGVDKDELVDKMWNKVDEVQQSLIDDLKKRTA